MGNSEQTKSSILVSACLLGESCRYNGQSYQLSGFVDSLQNYEIVSICPEVFGGLSVPRLPCEIKGGDGNGVWQNTAGVFTARGLDQTAAFQEGALKALAIAEKAGAKMAILKDNSPSCASHQIYDGSFCHRKVDGVGVTTALLRTKGIRVLAEKDWMKKRRGNDV
jgi:uncharacterized protein YbbK (DUF523 family)